MYNLQFARGRQTSAISKDRKVYAAGKGCVQTNATTPNIVGAPMLGVVACVLAVACKRMQQLPTMLGPAVHRGKDTTHKSL